MAAEVTGFIGDNNVELNNAATESTLRLLLAATAKSEAGIKAALDLAKKAGLDAETAEAAEAAMGRVAGRSNLLDRTFSILDGTAKKIAGNFDQIAAAGGSLIDNTASLSKLLGTLSSTMPKGIGMVIDRFADLARFQETNLKAYQEIASAGANFGGSLTDMRMAASRSYLTLNEFTALIKNNGAAFASLGDTTNITTKGFFNFTNSLIKSNMGTQLLAMGYSFEQINSNALDYLQISGGRTREEMRNTANLTEGTMTYMAELDKLTKLTGKNREKIAQEIKELALNPAWQAFLSDPRNAAAKDSLTLGLMEASRLGKSAAQNFQASALGLVVMNRETAGVAGLMSRSYGYLTEMGVVARSTLSTEEKKNKITELGSKATWAAIQQGNSLGVATLTAWLNYGTSAQKEAATSMLEAMTLANNRGIKNLDDQIAYDKKAAAMSFDLTSKQVEDAALVSKTLRELGTAILASLTPAIEFLTPALRMIANNFIWISGILLGLATAIGTLKLAIALGAKPEGKLASLFADRGHLPTKPLYVQIVGGNLPGGAPTPGGPEGGAESKGKFNWKGWLKGTAIMTAIMGALELPGIIARRSEIDEQSKRGEITPEQASKQKGKETGSAIGGTLLGSLAGAGAWTAAAALAPETAGLSFIIPAIAMLAAGKLGSEIGESVGGSVGEAVSGSPSSQPLVAGETEASQVRRTTETNDKMIRLLSEIRDISSEHRDIAMGTRRHRVETPSGEFNWQFNKN